MGASRATDPVRVMVQDYFISSSVRPQRPICLGAPSLCSRHQPPSSKQTGGNPPQAFTKATRTEGSLETGRPWIGTSRLMCAFPASIAPMSWAVSG